ncbi:MAG: RNA polymerase sigma factor [Oscillospiraceae bacterium]|nr:RNA polymerase sigma factor [Oscillospiraceae bacterium]
MDNGESSYRRFLSGDETAFDEILSQYRLKLIFFIDRIVHDPDTAEDIAIDVFVDLLVHPRRYDFRISMKSYLFMRGCCLALDYLRRRKHFSDGEMGRQPAADTDLEAQLLLSEQKKALHLKLRTLPNAMQQALHLVYFEELSYADAAKVMKLSSKQVYNLLYRGKERLRTILKTEGVEL